MLTAIEYYLQSINHGKKKVLITGVSPKETANIHIVYFMIIL